MCQRIDLATTEKAVRDFVTGLGDVREPVKLVLNGALVAKIIPATELSDAEKQRILREGMAVVDKARARTKDISASVIQKEVNEAVQECRVRHR